MAKQSSKSMPKGMPPKNVPGPMMSGPMMMPKQHAAMHPAGKSKKK